MIMHGLTKVQFTKYDDNSGDRGCDNGGIYHGVGFVFLVMIVVKVVVIMVKVLVLMVVMFVLWYW